MKTVPLRSGESNAGGFDQRRGKLERETPDERSSIVHFRCIRFKFGLYGKVCRDAQSSRVHGTTNCKWKNIRSKCIKKCTVIEFSMHDDSASLEENRQNVLTTRYNGRL